MAGDLASPSGGGVTAAGGDGEGGNEEKARHIHEDSKERCSGKLKLDTRGVIFGQQVYNQGQIIIHH